jgi:hypothetical protein
MYFEVLHVQPLKLNLSFTHEDVDDDPNQSILASLNPIAILVSISVVDILVALGCTCSRQCIATGESPHHKRTIG